MSKRVFGIVMRPRAVLQIRPNLGRWRANQQRVTRQHRPKR